MSLIRAMLPAALLLLCSCSLFRAKETEVYQQPRLVESARNASKEGAASVARQPPFTLSIQADPGLNRFRHSAHALHLCVYQLKEPNGFRQLGEEKEGLARLMECGRFDGSVAHASRMVVQPGERIRQTRERAEGVRYLGIATGYYGSARRKTFELVPVPEAGAVPATSVSIELGPGEIENVTVN